jgi:hypothetical protein
MLPSLSFYPLIYESDGGEEDVHTATDLLFPGTNIACRNTANVDEEKVFCAQWILIFPYQRRLIERSSGGIG